MICAVSWQLFQVSNHSSTGLPIRIHEVCANSPRSFEEAPCGDVALVPSP